MGESNGEVKTTRDSNGGVKLKKSLGLHNGVAIIVGVIIGKLEFGCFAKYFNYHFL